MSNMITLLHQVKTKKLVVMFSLQSPSIRIKNSHSYLCSFLHYTLQPRRSNRYFKVSIFGRKELISY